MLLKEVKEKDNIFTLGMKEQTWNISGWGKPKFDVNQNLGFTTDLNRVEDKYLNLDKKKPKLKKVTLPQIRDELVIELKDTLKSLHRAERFAKIHELVPEIQIAAAVNVYAKKAVHIKKGDMLVQGKTIYNNVSYKMSEIKEEDWMLLYRNDKERHDLTYVPQMIRFEDLIKLFDILEEK